MSNSSALVAAVELLDWLEIESNSSVLMEKDRNGILKLELRLLTMFLKYTANRCTHYENLQHLLSRMEDVGQNISKLHRLLLAPPTEEQPRCIPCSSLLNRGKIDDAVRHVLDKIQPMKTEMRQVLMEVSRLSGSGSRLGDELVVEFIHSLWKVVNEYYSLFGSSDLRIRVLKPELRFLKGLISLTAKRCDEQSDVFNKFFAHVQAVADGAAYIVYSCSIDEMDNVDMERGLDGELLHLVDKIDPLTPKDRETCLGVFKILKSSEPKSNIYEMGETTVDFVHSLLENTSKLLRLRIGPVNRQIQILDEEVRYFSKFLERKFYTNIYHSMDEEEFHRLVKSNDVLAYVEVLLIEAGTVIYPLLGVEESGEISEEIRLALSKLLKNLKLFNEVVRTTPRSYFLEEEMSNFRMARLGALDLLLRKLKELLNDGVDLPSLLVHQIQIIQRDLDFLRSFLNTITKKRHEQEKLEDLWRRIVHVAYEIGCVIDLALLKDVPDANDMFWLYDLIEKMKLIKTEISEIWISNKNMCPVQEHRVAEISSAHESPIMNASAYDEDMVGFVDEKEKVMQQLVRGSEQLQIVSIVGMPGLGKTFLAHKIYNDPMIKHQFYVYAWCSISQLYERKKLLTNILCQVKKSIEQKSEKTDEELAEELYKCLKGQKYLIVLDDMWDIEAWYALWRSFPNDNKGSRIIFTSRFSKLVSQPNCNIQTHRLRSFSDEESWDLLQKKTFQAESCPPELLQVGKEIAKRCGGLPLAVVVLAGLLAKTGREEERWKEVRDSLSSYIIGDTQRQCMDILDLSYKSLPDYLKLCFLYFGAFPEDQEIPVRKLTRLWIAEGFIQENETNLEYIAEDYLKDLINRSLIIASKKRSIGGVKTCLVHDLVREFCLAKAKEENFLMLIDGCGDRSRTSYDRCRVLVHDRQGKEIWSGCSGLFVRSLLFFTPRERPLLSNEVSSIIDGFKLLKVLDLMCINLGNCFPEAIKSLILLRYFSISGAFGSLPSSITNLRSLETFIVRGTIEDMWPKTILNMIKLRHLQIDRFTLSNLSELSELPGLRSISSASRLDSLQTISTLALLYGNDLRLMRKFRSLKKLSCEFHDSLYPSRSYISWALDSLSQLETLKISYLGNRIFPGMFSLPLNIKKLTLLGFRLSWEEISIVGKLPYLQVLKLLSNAFEGEEWNMQDEEFPKLKFLKLRFLDIKRWIASKDYFPPIEQLILDRCYQLEEIPDCLEGIPTLKKIRVYRCSNSLKDCIEHIEEAQRDMGNEKLKIEI